jgi:hypothetical protein
LKRIYISGPMTGYPLDNRPAFNQAATRLRKLGFEVINPAELDEIAPIHSGNWADLLGRDLKVLPDCDLVAVLQGWRNSRGAILETAVHNALGKAVIRYHDLCPIPTSALPRIVLP